MIIMITVIFSPAVYAQQASLSLSPTSGTFNKGCPFTLNIILNTGGAATDGTDVILIYDPSRFSATSISSGSIYSEYPGNNVDDVNGKVTVSGLASVTSAFSGSGTLATVNLLVKENAPAGASQIKFDFDPNDKSKTTDSNVVERGTVSEILNSVVNGSFIVGTGTCAVLPRTGVGTGQGTTGVGTPSAVPSTIDQIVDSTGQGPGTKEFTFMLAIVGATLTILGIIGMALL